MVTGLCWAIAWRNAAIPATGTNAELTNTTGKIHVKDAAWTASTFLRDRPMHAEIHENVNPTASTRTTTPIASEQAVLELEAHQVPDRDHDHQQDEVLE